MEEKKNMNEKIELMKSIIEYIPNLIKGIELFNDNIEQSKEEGIHNLLNQLLEGLEWVFKAISLTKDIYIKEVDMASFTALLSEMLDTIENDDKALMGDILNYEIADILREWKLIIEEELRELE